CLVSDRLIDYLTSNNLFEPFHRPFHSTETALTKVVNDLLLTADSGSASIVILLDLSAAFDTIDRDIMLDHLEDYLGICDMALSWFRSYLMQIGLNLFH
ncbi:hypothetical protein LDENG_00286830, partial [Lucifuga dentata]